MKEYIHRIERKKYASLVLFLFVYIGMFAVPTDAKADVTSYNIIFGISNNNDDGKVVGGVRQCWDPRGPIDGKGGNAKGKQWFAYVETFIGKSSKKDKLYCYKKVQNPYGGQVTCKKGYRRVNFPVNNSRSYCLFCIKNLNELAGLKGGVVDKKKGVYCSKDIKPLESRQNDDKKTKETKKADKELKDSIKKLEKSKRSLTLKERKLIKQLAKTKNKKLYKKLENQLGKTKNGLEYLSARGKASKALDAYAKASGKKAAEAIKYAKDIQNEIRREDSVGNARKIKRSSTPSGPTRNPKRVKTEHGSKGESKEVSQSASGKNSPGKELQQGQNTNTQKQQPQSPPPLYDSQSGGGSKKGKKKDNGGFGGMLGNLGKMLGGIGGGNKEKKQHQPKKKEYQKPQCILFTADRQTIHSGQGTTIRWGVLHSDYAEITPNIGSLRNPRQGVVNVTPSESTTYHLQGMNRYGYVQCNPVRVMVLPANQDIGSLDGSGEIGNTPPQMRCSPSHIVAGEDTSILWRCPNGTVHSRGVSTEYPRFSTGGRQYGSTGVAMSEAGTFVVRCYGASGREIGINSCRVEIDSSEMRDMYHAGESAEQAGITTPQLYITANKKTTYAGDIINLRWRALNVNNCSVKGPDGFLEIGRNGSIDGKLLQTSTFTLECKQGMNKVPSKSVTITVTND